MPANGTNNCTRGNRVSVNCDMGEGYGMWKMVSLHCRCLVLLYYPRVLTYRSFQGPDDELMPLIDLANVACGFHGGDPVVMHKTIRLAKRHGVPVGAHPSLPDREGFGRRHIDISPSDLFDQLVYQVGALVGILKAEGMPLNHIKTHGYVWRLCESSNEHCEAVMKACQVFRVPILVIAKTKMEAMAQTIGIDYISEFYPDIFYREDGKLMSIV